MTEEKITNDVFEEKDVLNEETDLKSEETDQVALDMETKNQQFDEDVEKALELLQNGDYFDTRSLLLSYNEVDIDRKSVV